MIYTLVFFMPIVLACPPPPPSDPQHTTTFKPPRKKFIRNNASFIIDGSPGPHFDNCPKIFLRCQSYSIYNLHKLVDSNLSQFKFITSKASLVSGYYELDLLRSPRIFAYRQTYISEFTVGSME